MSEKVPVIQNLLDNGMYMVASLAFGVGSWFFKIRQNKIKASAFSFFSEITFALLAGFITFWICQNFALSDNLMWILISINSWSGSKFLSILEYLSAKLLADKFGIDYVPVKSEEGTKPESSEISKPPVS